MALSYAFPPGPKTPLPQGPCMVELGIGCEHKSSLNFELDINNMLFILTHVDWTYPSIDGESN